MRSEDFLDILNQVDDDLLARSETRARPAKARILRRISAVAAMFAVILAGAIVWRMGRAGSPAGDGGGGSGNGEGWMLYVGPVLPLTSLDNADGIEAERHTDYDFSPYISDGDSYNTVAQISDRYTLHNPTAQDLTLTLAYPYSGRLAQDAKYLPQITVDGKTVGVTYYPGPYSGGYRDMYTGDGGSYNLAELTSFADYRSLLTEGNYMARAFDDFPVLDQPVTVYELTDPQNLGNASTLAMEFTVDPEKTTILSYGFNGAGYDPETGAVNRSLFIPTPQNTAWGEYQSYYIALLGEDIDSYTLQGYLDGGCDAGEEADATAAVTRHEMTLGELLMRIIEADGAMFLRTFWDDPDAETFIADVTLSDEMLLGLVAELLTEDGILSEHPADRYRVGDLMDIIQAVLGNQRILYLTFEVTVPAGGSVTVESAMLRQPHHDVYGHGKSGGGYDLATTLGSTLTFTAQRASVSSTEMIEIVDQNFGFHLRRGITEVTLDPAVEYYWMQVRRVSDDVAS